MSGHPEELGIQEMDTEPMKCYECEQEIAGDYYEVKMKNGGLIQLCGGPDADCRRDWLERHLIFVENPADAAPAGTLSNRLDGIEGRLSSIEDRLPSLLRLHEIEKE